MEGENKESKVYDYYREKNKKPGISKGKIVFLIVLAVVVIAAFIGSSIYMELIQLEELNRQADYTTVYTKNLLFKVIFFFASLVIMYLFIYFSNVAIIRNLKKYFKTNNLESRKMFNSPIALVISLLGAFFTKEFFFNKALLYINSVQFGKVDSQFGQDIGYYMFQRPFYMSLFDFVSNLWLFIVIYSAVYYVLVLLTALSNNFSFNELKDKTILRHNLINIAVFFVLKTISYKFQREDLLYSSFTKLNLTGAGYTNTTIWVNFYTFAPIIVLAIVILAAFFMWKGKLKKAAISIAIYPAIFILVTLASGVIQSVFVGPNEADYEKNYIKYNMQETRTAFGFDKIKPYDFSEVKDLTADIMERSRDTIDNIRVVDYNATIDSNRQLQSNTNFYTFTDGDILNYTVNGKEIPVLISAREINTQKLQNQNFINSTFKYTHGYGVVVNPINKLTSQGQVQFLMSELKMDSVDKTALNVTEPRIYYGELTNNYVIVNPKDSGKEPEIDYDGTAVSYFNTQDSGKINMGFLNRILFAAKYVNANLLVSSNVNSDSQILINRNVIQRAQKAVPFLKVDRDAAITITSDGRLVWVLDAYTLSANYPYGQHFYSQGNDGLQEFNGINYIRNSVKITIDAYSGIVNCYIIDEDDPIIQAYQKVYPGVFSKDPLPEDIRSHMRYPEAMFKIQTEVLKKYHIIPDKEENIKNFYTNQDAWNIADYPDETSPNGVKEIDAYYNMIKLPEELGTDEELILMRPYTPSGGRHNMVSWLAVRNSKDHYGEMILFNFPKSTNILGPYQVESNINQISEVSANMTLWGQSGSKVFKGSLLVIPIENSVLFIEPIYIKAETESSIPQVKMVVAGYQQGDDFKSGVGSNLDQALEKLFSGDFKPSGDKLPTVGQEGAAPPENEKPDETQKPPQNANQIDQAKLDELQKKLDDLMKQSQEINDLINSLRK